MYYEFELGMNGLLEAGVTSGKKAIHFEAPENTSYGRKVPITGDTYKYKADIKDHDWNVTHHEWTGEYWRVDLDAVREVMNTVCRAAGVISADPELVYDADSLTEYEGEIELDGEGSETFEFILGVGEGDERVSRSWAEDAAELGNFGGVEEFAERFNFEVVDDEVLFGEYENPEEVGEVIGEPPVEEAGDQYDLTG